MIMIASYFLCIEYGNTVVVVVVVFVVVIFVVAIVVVVVVVVAVVLCKHCYRAEGIPNILHNDT